MKPDDDEIWKPINDWNVTSVNVCPSFQHISVQHWVKIFAAQNTSKNTLTNVTAVNPQVAQDTNGKNVEFLFTAQCLEFYDVTSDSLNEW